MEQKNKLQDLLVALQSLQYEAYKSGVTLRVAPYESYITVSITHDGQIWCVSCDESFGEVRTAVDRLIKSRAA